MYTDIDTDADTALERVRALNDEARRYLPDGRLVISRGIAALAAEDQSAILERVRVFDAFTAENDPYGEHDFGAFECAGERVFWKIDLYEEPGVKGADGRPLATRVLTIMLAEEW